MQTGVFNLFALVSTVNQDTSDSDIWDETLNEITKCILKHSISKAQFNVNEFKKEIGSICEKLPQVCHTRIKDNAFALLLHCNDVCNNYIYQQSFLSGKDYEVFSQDIRDEFQSKMIEQGVDALFSRLQGLKEIFFHKLTEDTVAIQFTQQDIDEIADSIVATGETLQACIQGEYGKQIKSLCDELSKHIASSLEGQDKIEFKPLVSIDKRLEVDYFECGKFRIDNKQTTDNLMKELKEADSECAKKIIQTKCRENPFTILPIFGEVMALYMTKLLKISAQDTWRPGIDSLNTLLKDVLKIN